MKKAIIITVILILLSGCAIEQPEQEPFLAETESIAETLVENTYVEEVITLESESILEIEPNKEPEQPQVKPTEPPIAPQNYVTEPAPTTLESTAVSNPQTANPQITTPSTNPQTTPSQAPEPVCEPAPEPVVTEIPQEPTPPPAPPQIPKQPLVVSPPPARTICNTCGADITGNVPAHGTIHLLNGVSFSHRVE